ncbi:cytochrome P450 [Dacryopinax primogenitus]|uniref:Cytochrome P450 n=1 Tax=Dacryopinax primogenitus (strain DJM 731) TaxID=1858805 RepID=M5GE99_DACPD|nr:cytochrome P450 [Dacryopinax primogenitus]EJU05202.1 cytochrome P450 [Dacryopinax primogenitus]
MPDPIPSPPSYPVVGHALTGVIDPVTPTLSYRLLREKYGRIYELNFYGRPLIVVSSQKLVNELCDETRFHKNVSGALEEVRHGAGDGLFTAYHGEESWGIAHRILMPAFGPQQTLGMFNDMLDINSQLLFKWERFGPDHPIDPTDDFTRLAFDTVSLCAMSYRVNSFYQEELPAFVRAMGGFLVESGRRAQTPHMMQGFMHKSNTQYEADIKLMVDLCDKIIAQRKAHPEGAKNDLLNRMLEGKDPKTGRGLSDANIRNQLITFLIAGHETTSGLLSFTCYHLLANPSTYTKIQAEIDEVLGNDPIQLSHLPKLVYTNAVLRESIRLNAPLGMLNVTPNEDTIIGGRWEIKKDTRCVVEINGLQRDPEVWGDDAEEFRPERMLDGKFEALPPNSWKPFGNGARACIGRPFAWQEATMMMATMLQRFDLRFDDPSYHLHLKQTLTTKPKDFKMHAIPRRGARPIVGPGSLAGPQTTSPETAEKHDARPAEVPVGTGIPMYVYFGSNTGSCESFAQNVVSDALAHGFRAVIATLDSIDELAKVHYDGPMIILTASYEGQPADNAAHFVEGLQRLAPEKRPLTNLKYAVFGAGNRDWAMTYQRIPTLIDSKMEQLGAERLMERGRADAGGADFFGEFDKWEKNLWETLNKVYTPSTIEQPTEVPEEEEEFVVTVTGTARQIRLRQPDLRDSKVLENRLLTKPGAPEKRHIQFQLPEGMEYAAGDYLAILPKNPDVSVRRVLKHFNLQPDTKIEIKTKASTTLPTDEPIRLHDLFSEYVELAQPVTQRVLDQLLQFAPKDNVRLRDLLTDTKTAVFDKRLSALDLIEMYPDINIPPTKFVKLLPSMRIRQYSISSSPVAKPGECSLTVSIVRAPSLGGHGEFVGVASNYLAHLEVGDTVCVAVRPSAAKFHLPADTTKPIVMFCAGSGFAPMRGFIEDRAEQLAVGREVGKTLLFVGCRAPDEDLLYKDKELKKWQESGAVDVRPAFSRASDASYGCKYTQDRVWNDRADVKALYREGARFYTCGMSGMSNACREKCVDMIMEEMNCTQDAASQKFQDIAGERYSIDVFG